LFIRHLTYDFVRAISITRAIGRGILMAYIAKLGPIGSEYITPARE
jgi:hypothetical protein